MTTPMLPRPQHPPSSSSNQFNMASHNNSPYLSISPVPSSSRRATLCDVLNRCGKRIDNVWNHLRVSPSITDAAVARLVKGTKLLTEGGNDRLFQQTFQIFPGEKLLHSYVCYLSTSSGPVIGTLYISTKRIAFCSDHPLSYHGSPGYHQWLYYKVVIELDKLVTVDSSENRLKPSDKYIHMITRDGHEFWFMGFISYDKALRSSTEALQHSRHASSLF